jgi:tRNA A-37 threonylcarbamoyl transferase component Bud32
LRASGAVVDFRRICRIDSGLLVLAKYEFDLSRFNETSILKQGSISTKIYQRVDDGFRIIVKSLCLLKNIESERLQQEIENLMNLRHSCIVCPIGFFLPSQSQSQLWGFEIVSLYYWGGSLSEAISVSPELWTPTAQAKTIVVFVLGLRFAYSLGLLHGHLTMNNVFFKEDGVIQIIYFCLNRLMKPEWNNSGIVDAGSFFGECYMPTSDVLAFTEILSEITMGGSEVEGVSRPDIPGFVV